MHIKSDCCEDDEGVNSVDLKYCTDAEQFAGNFVIVI